MKAESARVYERLSSTAMLHDKGEAGLAVGIGGYLLKSPDLVDMLDSAVPFPVCWPA